MIQCRYTCRTLNNPAKSVTWVYLVLPPALFVCGVQLLVAGYSAHNVFASGSGVDVCLDHHGGAPHNNLWTDIDLVSVTLHATLHLL
jgi:hypothetical protein